MAFFVRDASEEGGRIRGLVGLMVTITVMIVMMIMMMMVVVVVEW